MLCEGRCLCPTTPHREETDFGMGPGSPERAKRYRAAGLHQEYSFLGPKVPAGRAPAGVTWISNRLGIAKEPCDPLRDIQYEIRSRVFVKLARSVAFQEDMRLLENSAERMATRCAQEYTVVLAGPYRFRRIVTETDTAEPVPVLERLLPFVPNL